MNEGAAQRGKSGGDHSTSKTPPLALRWEIAAVAVQGLPLQSYSATLSFSPSPYPFCPYPQWEPRSLPLLLLTKFISTASLCFAIRPSYDRTQATGGWLFWLSPLADPWQCCEFSYLPRTPTSGGDGSTDSG